jgi:hypothetical protein
MPELRTYFTPAAQTIGVAGDPNHTVGQSNIEIGMHC